VCYCISVSITPGATQVNQKLLFQIAYTVHFSTVAIHPQIQLINTFEALVPWDPLEAPDAVGLDSVFGVLFHYSTIIANQLEGVK